MDVVLVLADADALGIDLHQLCQRILQAAGDGDCAAHGQIEIRELLAGDLAGGVHAGARLVDADADHAAELLLGEDAAYEALGFATVGAVADGHGLHPVTPQEVAERHSRALHGLVTLDQVHRGEGPRGRAETAKDGDRPDLPREERPHGGGDADPADQEARDADEPELCLQGVEGQFSRLSPGGATRRTQGCPVLAARTGFWRYTRDGPALRVLPAAGAARAGERRLVDGRFTDEVITGAPVTGTKDRRTFTLVPTSAAVMWWDDAGQVVDMHAPPFQGKPDVPRLLQWTADGSPAYVADGTLYSLENDDKPRGSWTVRLPPDAVFERLASGPGPLLSIDWSQDGRRHHSVVDPRNSSVSA